MKEDKKGYWVYSGFAIILGMTLFGVIAYLIYDLILKLATTQITNSTLVQSLITLIITIFLGGYFSENLKQRNNKKLETYKTQKDVALNIINLMGMIVRDNSKEEAKQLLINETYKVKLFFDDELLKAMNNFCTEENTEKYNYHYNNIVDKLQKYFK